MTTAPEDTTRDVTPRLATAVSLIERVWPAQKLSAEAQKERKSGAGQTLTSLGSYWKGRKPLILVKACILACLLPATEDAEQDLAVFERLMGMDDEAFLLRLVISASDVALRLIERDASDEELSAVLVARKGRWADGDDLELRTLAERRRLAWRSDIAPSRHRSLLLEHIAAIPYADRVVKALRPEETTELPAAEDWLGINAHLGTDANSMVELVEQLGRARFGRRPKVGDAFAGGGSIPFEAARLGCDVYAGDLNPVACMLNWGAVHIVGADRDRQADIAALKRRTIAAVADDLAVLDLETNERGDRAKAYLYCLETKCPQTGWSVPMLPTLIVSRTKNVVARLVADPSAKRYEIVLDVGADAGRTANAEIGTVRNGALVHTVDGEVFSTSIKSLRGDRRTAEGSSNELRAWTLQDFEPAEGDVFQERLYAIQWITHDSLEKGRQETFFAAPDESDQRREARVREIVQTNLERWQRDGLVPDQRIEPGEKTDEPIRTRGWTHWHHLFSPRQLVVLSALKRHAQSHPETHLDIAKAVDRASKLCRWTPGSPGRPGVAPTAEKVSQVFDNQALNTFYNYAERSGLELLAYLGRYEAASTPVASDVEIVSTSARDTAVENDIFITDPPYADAVNYHEITEFFIAWLRGNPPPPFDAWTWDSRRPLAIKGEGDVFRRDMVASYKAMADAMPDNGLQVVMFTHQSGSVWADLAQIFWGAGLQVRAAWYIATETTSELKKGGYVQGTVILVLRKRQGAESGYEDEIVLDVRQEVARQIDTMVGLNQQLKGAGRVENLFEDADLQMAGYAAALRVLTSYTTIDNRDMTAEAMRTRRKGEVAFVDRMIEFAVGVANEHMVPDGLRPALWQQLKGAERFYLKMVGLEADGIAKLDNYQNFARAFRVPDYAAFMASMKPNAARLKNAIDFGPRSGFDDAEFGKGVVRAVLFATDALSRENDAAIVLEQLRDIVPDYFKRRPDMVELAEYIGRRRGRENAEGRHASILANLLRNERL